jgi:hypothetical protein
VVIDMSIRDTHLEDGNIFMSNSVSGDALATELGYKFLGVSLLNSKEVHIWEIMSLDLYRDTQ